ncbi:MAG: amidohydrolase family protein, partial [Paracoccus sp.]|nr:amidohydrolase family protein [Paracoccus sp. (in: a-proteobacteria)]
MNLRFLSSTAMAAFATLAAPALAGDPDLILYNGALLTMDPDAPQASAIAITGTRISAVGDDAGVRATAGKDTRQIDLSGKTVIPGLVDTHIHAIRGGQTYRFETHWFDNPTLAGAIGELRQAATERGAGEWVAVVGSWIPEQFSEQRPP